MQKSTSQNDAFGFRTKPAGPIIRLTRPQYRKLVRCIAAHPQGILGRTILELTDIEQYSARIAEIRKLGLPVEVLPLLNAQKGDRRKLFRIPDYIELVEGRADGNGS